MYPRRIKRKKHDEHLTPREEAEKMWTQYTTEVNKYDKNVADAQKDDANGVLVFVSHILLILLSIEMSGFIDWSLLCSRHPFYYRKL